jgi:hypothetical protein
MERILTDAELQAAMSQDARRIDARWDNERMVKGFLQALEYVSLPPELGVFPISVVRVR